MLILQMTTFCDARWQVRENSWYYSNLSFFRRSTVLSLFCLRFCFFYVIQEQSHRRGNGAHKCGDGLAN